MSEAGAADGSLPPDPVEIMHTWPGQTPNATSSQGTDGQQVQDKQSVSTHIQRLEYKKERFDC